LVWESVELLLLSVDSARDGTGDGADGIGHLVRCVGVGRAVDDLDGLPLGRVDLFLADNAGDLVHLFAFDGEFALELLDLCFKIAKFG